MNKYEISYNGKTIKTKNWVEVSQEELKKIREKYYLKPEKETVLAQMKKITNDGVMVDKITKFYFRDLMAKTLCDGAKWSVEEVFNSTDLCGIFKAKVLNSPQVFPPSDDISKSIERAISLGGKGYARIPTQFPFKTVNYIYSKYNVNNIVYDFSCGWGMRLLGALKYNLNYYGTDPNYLLCERLKQMSNDYKEIIKRTNIIDIKCAGSEDFIPELEGKVGLAFSSPPYFSLEDYKIGKQSWHNGMSYEEWLNNYLYKTLDNCIKYLIKGGYLALNIKNISVPIADDANNFISRKINFIEAVELKNIKRLKSTGGAYEYYR